MATIGTFTNVNDILSGEIETISVKAKLTITPVSSDKGGAPNYRVMAGNSEIGAGWTRKSKNGRDYISVKIDDPIWQAPLYANLIERGGVHTLIWNRRETNKAAA